ncbi:4-hydroxybenzoate 3-monooxygenase [Aciditerrimonas ferrireducens]|uniref:4-hydroxybenzoate 3-monooxygenase n=1 Tax=Aciditerrimonas ferrireducens TaxID=667306 RepID=UPI002006554E|nr:4-hydroxybenzoate 3-monooxygenase [Aciditerrimonas ferrireducens]MCK4176245.1 4-hydroxybenzoate 3-monooxygenase [Aciditerrimonas ferrireducens]
MQVAVVGGGPAGSLLGILLHRAGLDVVVLERRSVEHVRGRIRAGVLEHPSVTMLREHRLADRVDREGMRHEGVVLSDRGDPLRVDFQGLTGHGVVVYGQTELQKDLFAAIEAEGVEYLDEIEELALGDVTNRPVELRYRRGSREETLLADVVAGCDGAHGVTADAVPRGVRRTYERYYPFGWLGIMAETAPVHPELIYARHERGFALCSMRHARLSRYYLQAPLDTDLGAWPDDRFWDELRRRIPPAAAERLETGPSIEKSLTPLRSAVGEPMAYGFLALAGDAAHSVPPTGAKGLNLALADVVDLAEVLLEAKDPGPEALQAYSDRALRRVWRAVRFSWWMTTVLHRFPDDGPFAERIQDAELALLRSSVAARRAMAEQYVGILP